MMKNTIKTVLFSAIIIAVYGCDCAYYYTIYAQNNSKSKVLIKYQVENSNEMDSVLVDVNEQVLLAEDYDYFPGGGCPGFQCSHYPNIVLSLEVKADTSSTFSSWQYDCDQITITEIEKGHAEMAININNSDLE